MQKQAEDTVVIEGKNLDEALQAACDRLDTTPNQVEYEVVNEGRSGGVLGFLRGRSVKVKVTRKSVAQRMIHEIVAGLFERMRMNVEHKVLRGEDAYEIEIETEDSDGLLIGRGGDTLKALQHLISRMVGQQDETVRVRVDVAGYRKRRTEQLRKKAHDLAERARGSSRDVMSEPLPADERRILHLALADDDSVSTRAVGDGQTKRVAVSAAGSGRRSGSGSNGGPRRRSSGGGRGRSERGDRGDRGDRGQSRRRPRRRDDRRDEPRVARDVSDAPDMERRDSEAPSDRPSRGRDRDRGRSRDRGRDRDRRPAADRGRDRDRDRDRQPAAAAREEKPEQVAEKEREPEFGRRGRGRGKPTGLTDSYFNIPATVEDDKADGAEGKESGSDKASEEKTDITWGRRRRPGRGRR